MIKNLASQLDLAHFKLLMRLPPLLRSTLLSPKRKQMLLF
jgi:hypothetical protein